MKYPLIILIFCFTACTSTLLLGENPTPAELRKAYSKPPEKWPSASLDSGVNVTELGLMPEIPVDLNNPKSSQMVALGKQLFFDTRLSESGKISCASCHKPELHFTDGKTKSLGHEDAENKRNSQGLFNIWADKKFFWDGRSSSLEDQAFFPINSESEMHSDMGDVMRKIRRVDSYKVAFEEVFGEPANPDNMTEAIAMFERTLKSSPSDFDRFLKGDVSALSDDALKGLHLFRTKAGCINCHNGPFFKDQDFHNLGLPHQKEDIGLNWVSRKEEDLAKFKTPGLRDVVYTGPWLHDGSGTDLKKLVRSIANNDVAASKSRHIRDRKLSEAEIENLLAFLAAISAKSPAFDMPDVPK